MLCKIESEKCEEFSLCGLSFLTRKIKKVKTNLVFFCSLLWNIGTRVERLLFHLKRLSLSLLKIVLNEPVNPWFNCGDCFAYSIFAGRVMSTVFSPCSTRLQQPLIGVTLYFVHAQFGKFENLWWFNDLWICLDLRNLHTTLAIVSFGRSPYSADSNCLSPCDVLCDWLKLTGDYEICWNSCF